MAIDVQQPGPGLPDGLGPCCVVGSLSKVIISSITNYVLVRGRHFASGFIENTVKTPSECLIP